MNYYIDGPKTQSGIRKISMNEEVYQAFQRMIKTAKVQSRSLLAATPISCFSLKLLPNSIRVIDKENSGHGSKINVAIQKASGAYFQVVNADD